MKFGELDELLKKAIEYRKKRKYYEEEYKKLRQQLEVLMLKRYHVASYYSSDGIKAQIKSKTVKRIDPQKLKDLVDFANEHGYPITVEDLYTEKETTFIDIKTPQDLERARKFAKKKK